MIKAVIFDLDGTIGDTMPLIIRSFRDAIQPYAQRSITNEEIISTFGRSEEGTIKMMIPEHYDQGFAAYLQSYTKYQKQYSKPFNGITELIQYLKSKHILLGLVTGKGPKSCEITLRAYGYESLFDGIDTGVPEGPRKPEGLRALLSQFSLEPNEVIYIGDAPSDITACEEVGVPIISAAWADSAEKKKLKEMNPDFTFESVEAFSEYLKSII